MAEGTGKKKVVKHVREVNNYIRGAVIKGKDLNSETDREDIIKDFLSKYAGVDNAMTPELFLFFLQKLNSHALFESMDNTKYTVVYPTYIPFDPVVVAAKHGFPDIIKNVERRLVARSKNAIGVKTAAAVLSEYKNEDYLDKVAGANGVAAEAHKAAHDEIKDRNGLQRTLLMDKASHLYWSFKDIELLTKTSVFKANPRYRHLLKEISNKPVMGMRDKSANINDLKSLMEIFDDIIELN